MMRLLRWLNEKWHTPIDSVIDGEGHRHDIYRCQADGKIVFETQSSLRQHAGHKMKQPVFLNLFEKFVFWKAKSQPELEKILGA